MRIRSHRSLARGSRQSGFTLIEMMITVSIVAVVLAMGVPSLQGFILGQRVKAASFDLQQALLMARSEAIKRNAPVVITPADAGWAGGWSVTAGSELLARQSAYRGISIDSEAASVSYGTNGRLTDAAPSFAIAGGSSESCITISLAGLPRSKTGSCG